MIITSLPYTITAPGSYELADNLPTTGHGITINCDDVSIDLNGHSIIGNNEPASQYYGINAFNRERITLRNGQVRGFMYGVYLSDLIDSVRPNGSLNGGGHVVEQLSILNCKFRGIRVEGNGNLVRDNVIRETGGCTVYPNAYAFAIESFGPGAMIEGNRIYEVRGGGVADIGEGVGISVSDYGSGSVIKDNIITQSTRELASQYTDWPAESRSSYGIWVGGDTSDVLVDSNIISNFVYGITYKRTTYGVFQNNRVSNSVVPYYLPNLAGQASGAFARDGGGNHSDISALELLPGRETPGPVEYVEKVYLPPRS